MFERKIVWTQPFAAKAFLGILNIPLFFFMMRWLLMFITQFEVYNFTGVGSIIQDILPGLAAENYNYLRKATFICGISTIILIFVFEIRMIYSVFRYRENKQSHILDIPKK